MFYRVHRRVDNNPMAIPEAIAEYSGELGDYFGFIETDIIILPTEPCWLKQLMDLMDADPKLGMLGSLIDKSDFIDPQWAAQRFPTLTEERLNFFIKTKSPERAVNDTYNEPLIDPYNPPGRLLFLRTEAIRRTEFLTDYKLYLKMREMGYKTAISTRVRHRHLSLVTIFDYPEYQDMHTIFHRKIGQMKSK
jgi:GT2 family glycosyltransferase